MSDDELPRFVGLLEAARLAELSVNRMLVLVERDDFPRSAPLPQGREGEPYELMVADCLWHVYRLMGKTEQRVYVLTKPT